MPYQSTPDDTRVTVNGKFYKLDAYSTCGYPFAWGIRGSDDLITCSPGAPTWKRTHREVFTGIYGEVPDRSAIKVQGRLWLLPDTCVIAFWDEYTAEEAVKTSRELIAKWNAKFARKKKLLLTPKKCVVCVGSELVNVETGPTRSGLRDGDKSKAFATHLASAEEKRSRLGGYLRDRAEHTAAKLGNMSRAEYNFRRYQESYKHTTMKSLSQFITEAKGPRGTRGYVALMRCKDKSIDIVHMPYDPDPMKAVVKITADPRKKFEELSEGPRILTLKGYNWYYDDYLGYKYAYGDNGYMSGNYDRERWTPEEAWEILCDPKNKYTKEA